MRTLYYLFYNFNHILPFCIQIVNLPRVLVEFQIPDIIKHMSMNKITNHNKETLYMYCQMVLTYQQRVSFPPVTQEGQVCPWS